MNADNTDYVKPPTGDRLGPPCPHGSLTVCPHCDPRGFLIAYAKTVNIIERMGHTDAEIERMVDKVRLR